MDVAANVSRCGWNMHEAETRSVPRLVLRWGVSAGSDPNIAEALVYSAEALSGWLIVDIVVGHSGQ